MVPVESGDVIVEWIEASVDRRKEAPAILGVDGIVSFGELNSRANRLARFLRANGVEANARVGIFLERSADLIVAILAVLKSGGAYVPIDPAYPKERIDFLVNDAAPVWILTQEKFCDALGNPKNIFCLDDDANRLENLDESNLDIRIDPESLIYVIYTSGSTGRPKGAGVKHSGFANLMCWFVDDFGISENDRNLLMSSASFDLTQKNFFATLISGGQLHLLPHGPYDPQQIREQVAREKITLMNCTPSAFYPLIEGEENPGELASLRCVFLGGEPIAADRVRPLVEKFGTEIVNTYGPTECTDISAFYRMNRANLDAYESLPVGGAVPNVQITILDESLNVRPTGEAGEICIGGAGVGVGYLTDPELTKQKFIPSSFFKSEKIYRTGDMGRLLPDGNVEFLGRRDHQVKVRGFRVELPEIERCLMQHPKVSEAVVVVCVANNNHLIACYTAHARTPISETSLQSHIESKLPDYMMPASFLFFKNFPLSPNGKVDRRMLQKQIDPGSFISNSNAISIEDRVLDIWRNVLKRDNIDLNENFFDLGGNSLDVARVQAELKKQMNRDVPVTVLFQYPTMRALCDYLESSSDRSSVMEGIRERMQRQQDALKRFRKP